MQCLFVFKIFHSTHLLKVPKEYQFCGTWLMKPWTSSWNARRHSSGNWIKRMKKIQWVFNSTCGKSKLLLLSEGLTAWGFAFAIFCPIASGFDLVLEFSTLCLCNPLLGPCSSCIWVGQAACVGYCSHYSLASELGLSRATKCCVQNWFISPVGLYYLCSSENFFIVDSGLRPLSSCRIVISSLMHCDISLLCFTIVL